MSHLGSLISAFVDGQLDPQESARVRAHVAGCTPCLVELRAARSARATLAGVGGVDPDPGFTARLLALGCGASAPERPAVTLGADSLAMPGSGLQRGTLDGDLGPHRRPVLPILAGVAGAGLLAACFTLGAEPEVLLDDRPVEALSALQAAAVSSSTADVADLDDWLADHPWAAPVVVPDQHVVTAVKTGADEVEIDMIGPDGLVVVRQTRGRLGEVGVAVEVAGHEVRKVAESPPCVAWQSGDAVVSVIAESSHRAVEPVIDVYPVQAYDDGASARVGRGWNVLLTAWSDT